PTYILGDYEQVPSPKYSRVYDTFVNDAPATVTSSYSFGQSQELLTAGSSWCSTPWAGGTYAGPIDYTNGSSEVTITLPSPSSAIYLYADPDDLGTFNMKVTATAANGSTVSSGDVAVTN